MLTLTDGEREVCLKKRRKRKKKNFFKPTGAGIFFRGEVGVWRCEDGAEVPLGCVKSIRGKRWDG